VTGPLGSGSLGDAYINVHARTDDVEPDVRKGLDKAGKDSEKDADNIGKNIGDHLGDGIEKEVSRHGPSIAKTIGKSVEKEVVDVKPNFRYDVRGRDGRFISRAAANIREEVEEAFAGAASGASGIFGKIGTAISDAIGAGFNVSGKSPLVYILAPVYAAIGGLVIAAIQAANGVIAAILAIPAAISVLLVEIGVLYLAFHGLGDAIQGAFAAKNATELNEALKNLTPSAQGFVRALLPAKSLFDELSKSAQEAFFAAIGGGQKISALLTAIAGPLKAGIPIVAASLGRFFDKLISFFSSPLFTAFLDKIFPAVAQIVDMLGGPFIDFLVGLFVLIVQSLPFLLELTSRFGDLLTTIGNLLAGVSPDWLNEMLTTLDKTFELFGALIGLIAVLFAQVNSAGGNELLDFLIEATTVLTGFFASPIGKEAIAGLIRLAEAGIFILIALIEAIALVAAGFQLLTNTIGTFFHWLLEVAFPAIGRFFSGLGSNSDAFFATLRNNFTNAIGLITTLPGKAAAALANIGTTLVSAGRNLIQGLINGIMAALGPLRATLNYVTALIPSWKGPETKDRRILEPAGRAVMEGFGAGIQSGAADIKAMLGDFTTGLGGIGINQSSTHILFGANALQVNFNGALPTSKDAMATGVAVGTGINAQIAARNTKLAVRTL
jgi:hypothetical protein